MSGGTAIHIAAFIFTVLLAVVPTIMDHYEEYVIM